MGTLRGSFSLPLVEISKIQINLRFSLNVETKQVGTPTKAQAQLFQIEQSVQNERNMYIEKSESNFKIPNLNSNYLT